jgi:hypothetical protein
MNGICNTELRNARSPRCTMAFVDLLTRETDTELTLDSIKKTEYCSVVRDRPFNLKGEWGLWFFVSFRIFFSNNTRVRIFIFFCRAKRKFFFQNLTLGYMTKSVNQFIFFSSTKIRIFFSATLGIRIFF